MRAPLELRRRRRGRDPRAVRHRARHRATLRPRRRAGRRCWMPATGVVVVDRDRRRERERTHVPRQESSGPASMPPSARNSEPVQYDDRSDARKSATPCHLDRLRVPPERVRREHRRLLFRAREPLDARGPHHLGVDRTGVDRVHPDPERPELDRGSLRHAPDRELARGVAHRAGVSDQPVDRRDVDDRSAARPLHRRRDRPHAEEATDLIDVDHREVVVEGHLRQWGELEDACVVDEHRDRAERALGLHDRGRPVGLGRDVEVHVAGGVTELVGDLLPPVVEHVTEHDACAFLGEQPRFRLALTTCCAGDDGDLPVESSHHRLTPAIQPPSMMNSEPCSTWSRRTRGTPRAPRPRRAGRCGRSEST